MANIGHWSLYGYGLWSLRIKDNNEYIGRVGIIKPAMFSLYFFYFNKLFCMDVKWHVSSYIRGAN